MARKRGALGGKPIVKVAVARPSGAVQSNEQEQASPCVGLRKCIEDRLQGIDRAVSDVASSCGSVQADNSKDADALEDYGPRYVAYEWNDLSQPRQGDPQDSQATLNKLRRLREQTAALLASEASGTPSDYIPCCLECP